ncbi:MAG: extracellular solute-binding protein [Verrucomicrobiota bacterium]
MNNDPKENRRQFLRVLTHFDPFLFMGTVAALVIWLLSALGCSRSTPSSDVVTYAAQDQVYAEPILQQFEKESGIKVKAVYDSEAVKTVGLANRLIAERDHPQCDVFWGNEEMRTRQLAAQNVFRETNGWVAFGYRSRRIVINTNKLSLIDAPKSLFELTNETWRGKVALAFPQFGTTATHFHALKQLWGNPNWLMWCRALAANKPFIVDGNSVVVKFVTRGEAWIGLSDSDDIAAAQAEGAPLAALPLNAESLLIPNTIAVIRNAPHPSNAQKLFDYLQRRQVADKLVAASALESATNAPVNIHMTSNWDALLGELETTTKQLNEIFLR